ncbi:histidine kinase [Streptomyces sp. N2-109]|uniref:histidine kinase n=2 Tax=Streptomyces gossypii TaxID=2883101 RepID=A0ABT2JZ98_9ACTN|nr:sensor histidine kinase [Streptomyces gossypii]MCT2593021.1 histidine kinase [Streptomyces gossypii]
MREAGEGGPLWWTRRRSCVLDVTLAVLSAVECAFEGGKFAQDTGLPVALAVVMGLLVGSVLVLRRRWPIVVVLVAISVTPAEMGVLIGVAGFYTLAASEMPRRIIGLLAGMQVAGGIVITWIRMHQSIGQEPDFNPDAWFIPLISVLMSVGMTLPPVLMGLYVGARRRLVESLRERADGLERELSLLADRAEERAEWARNEERTRIAREMHDVVAHRVSLMVVHAAALQAVALKDPEKASRNAALLGDMGRQALTELRTMLGVLRTVDTNGAPPVPAERESLDRGPVERDSVERESAGREAAEREWAEREARAEGKTGARTPLAAFAAVAGEPGDAAGRPGHPEHAAHGPDRAAAGSVAAREGAGSGAVRAAAPPGPGSGPTLGELDVLVGQSREAGMVVELSVEGSSRAYAARVEQTAFRVVQEALTNVHKHAAGARTRVRLAHREGEVALQVENEPPSEGGADAGLPSGGNGLLGMRERVTTLGGVFVSGPTDAGGFRVSAVIPGESGR